MMNIEELVAVKNISHPKVSKKVLISQIKLTFGSCLFFIYLQAKRRHPKLKVGLIKRERLDSDEEDDKKLDAWSKYMKEVKKYKEKHGDDSDKNRPLVKQIIAIKTTKKIELNTLRGKLAHLLISYSSHNITLDILRSKVYLDMKQEKHFNLLTCKLQD